MTGWMKRIGLLAIALAGAVAVASSSARAQTEELGRPDAASVSETYQRVFGVPLSPDVQQMSQSGTRGGSNE